MVAMLFILFDIEVVFLYPVGVILNGADSVFVLVEILIFVALLFVALVYVWRRGALDWKLKREKIRSSLPLDEPGPNDRLRVRQHRARDMLRGDLEGVDLDELVEEALAHDPARQGPQLGPRERDVPGHVRPRLLRDRDDVDRQPRGTTSPGSAPRRCAPRRARPTS